MLHKNSFISISIQCGFHFTGNWLYLCTCLLLMIDRNINRQITRKKIGTIFQKFVWDYFNIFFDFFFNRAIRYVCIYIFLHCIFSPLQDALKDLKFFKSGLIYFSYFYVISINDNTQAAHFYRVLHICNHFLIKVVSLCLAVSPYSYFIYFRCT